MGTLFSPPAPKPSPVVTAPLDTPSDDDERKQRARRLARQRRGLAGATHTSPRGIGGSRSAAGKKTKLGA